LHLMEPGRPIAMGKLAETLACDASNVTGLVDRLESRGLIRRSPSLADRRLKVLVLTPVGTQLRAALLQRMTQPPEALKPLSQTEQHLLVQILRHLMSREP